MSTVSQVKKLKITVTNIKSVLMKRTKRLDNLKKINKRDNKNLLSSQKKRGAESKLESSLKGIGKIGSGISNITKAATGINLGGIFDAFKLLGLGVGVNAVFNNIDEIKEGVNNLKKKVNKWWDKSRTIRKSVKDGLDLINGKKLKEMSDKFFNQSKKLDKEFEKLKDPNSTYTIPDPDNPNKEITISPKEYYEMSNRQSGLGLANPNFKEENFYGQPMQPIKKDTNLSSLLNSNGSSGDTAYLLRQNIIHEA